MEPLPYDFLNVNWAFGFYRRRKVRLAGDDQFYVPKDGMGGVQVGYRYAQEAPVEGFIFDSNPSFVVSGELLELVVKRASPVIRAERDRKHRHSFAALGRRSIEPFTDRYGEMCSIESFLIPDELFDWRDRLVCVLNDAITEVREV
jgi:hypothetical protein